MVVCVGTYGGMVLQLVAVECVMYYGTVMYSVGFSYGVLKCIVYMCMSMLCWNSPSRNVL